MTRLARVHALVAVALFAALTAVVALQVVNRLVLHLPITWSEEIARFLFFWVVLLGWLAFGERPTRPLWCGLAVAAAGLLLVLEPWRPAGNAASTVMALAGGFAWAVGVVLSKRLFQRGGVGALSLTAWQMLFGTLVIIAIACFVPEKPVAWTHAFVAALAYNVLLASGTAWALWSFVVAQLPASVAGLSTLAIPVLGIAFAWLLLGERPGAWESVGVALIVGALALVNLRRAR